MYVCGADDAGALTADDGDVRVGLDGVGGECAGAEVELVSTEYVGTSEEVATAVSRIPEVAGGIHPVLWTAERVGPGERLGGAGDHARRDCHGRARAVGGDTEANNLAILGMAASAHGSRGTEEVVEKTPTIRRDSFRQPPPSPSVVPGSGLPDQIIISACEHQSVIEPAEHLLEQGWRLDTLGLTPDGVVRVERLSPLLDVELPCASRLVSVMLGNHETGVLQPVAELAAICNRAGVPMHTDAIQVAGRLPVNFRELDVAAMTIAAHKFQGPLGIGASVRQDVPLSPLMFGGHQQAGLRPGTESVTLAVGMAAALEFGRRNRTNMRQNCERCATALSRACRSVCRMLSFTGPGRTPSADQQRGLSRSRWRGLVDGLGPCRRGLFGRLGLF